MTERSRLEATLVRAQKMEALGRLAGEVSHDFNNLLTGTLGCFRLLGKHVASEEGMNLLGEGHKLVERGASLTRRLLAFARDQPLATETVDVNSLIDGVTEMLVMTLGSHVRLEKRPGATPWPAVGNRSQLEIALLNLAVNARDAMPDGGVLTLSTTNETVDAATIGVGPGQYVAVVVSDDGLGMSADVLARAMDPFFTTKEEGRGTGLGLSMVYGLMRQIGGGVSIDSAPGSGTAVTLYLPRAEVAVTPAARTHTPSLPILVVDDDFAAQATVSGFAAHLGRATRVAMRWADAEAVLNGGERFAAVVVELSLPDVAASPKDVEVAIQRRGMPLVGMSAVSADEGWSAGTPALVKPFGPAEFGRALSLALGREHGRRGDPVFNRGEEIRSTPAVAIPPRFPWITLNIHIFPGTGICADEHPGLDNNNPPSAGQAAAA